MRQRRRLRQHDHTNAYCTPASDSWEDGPCSQDCTSTCPARDGLAVTFCIDGDVVGESVGCARRAATWTRASQAAGLHVRRRAALQHVHDGGVDVPVGAVGRGPADTIEHYGPDDCRPISGTSTLSERAFANAIDIVGVGTSTGARYTVLDHWKDGDTTPETESGR